jgi:putative endonuclease
MVPSVGWAKEGFKRSGSELRMAGHQKTMFYTYILQSVSDSAQLYRGHTSDLKQRLLEHNAGKCPHTAKFLPWRIKFYAAFETLEVANAGWC